MIFRTLFFVTASLVAATALAQYKYVGPDGRVVYSDTPPPANVKGVEKKALAPRTPEDNAGSNLPYALQQSVRTFPVTLYTAETCPGCEAGRAFLVKRGIPFTEKTVKSNDDIEALRKATGSAAVPVLVVGNSKYPSYEPGAWGDLLDSGGYPQTSQLPPSYKPPAVTSAAPEKQATTAQAPAQPKPAPAAPPQPPAAPPESSSGRPEWFKGF